MTQERFTDRACMQQKLPFASFHMILHTVSSKETPRAGCLSEWGLVQAFG